MKSWKKDLSAVKDNIDTLVIQDHHLIRKHYTNFPNRLSRKKFTIFLSLKKKKQLH